MSRSIVLAGYNMSKLLRVRLSYFYEHCKNDSQHYTSIEELLGYSIDWSTVGTMDPPRDKLGDYFTRDSFINDALAGGGTKYFLFLVELLDSGAHLSQSIDFRGYYGFLNDATRFFPPTLKKKYEAWYEDNERDPHCFVLSRDEVLNEFKPALKNLIDEIKEEGTIEFRFKNEFCRLDKYSLWEYEKAIEFIEFIDRIGYLDFLFVYLM